MTGHLLVQNTASQELLVGPFVDTADGDTAMTALTIANTDIKLNKGGTLTLVSKNSGGATHVADGWYSMTLDATDSDTLGSGVLKIHVATALPVVVRFTVVTAAAYAFQTTGLLAVGAIDAGAITSAQQTILGDTFAAMLLDAALTSAHQVTGSIGKAIGDGGDGAGVVAGVLAGVLPEPTQAPTFASSMTVLQGLAYLVAKVLLDQEHVGDEVRTVGEAGDVIMTRPVERTGSVELRLGHDL